MGHPHPTTGRAAEVVCYKREVPRFEAFAGIRYDLDRFDPAEVTAPPYDVIDEDERAALAERSPHNIVTIDLPRGGGDPYADAARTFVQWQTDGVLITDEPSFYVYQMASTDESGQARQTTGVIGALELSRPGEGGILPHERTTPKAKSDRLHLLRATATDLSPVWGLSPATGLTTLLETNDPPLTSWVADDGVTHALWRVSDPDRLEKIGAAVGSGSVVIADGHHRYETALTYRDERTASGQPIASNRIMTYVVELAEEQLTVLPIHRLIAGLPDGFDLRAALAPSFEVTPAGPVDAGITASMRKQGYLVLIEKGRTSLLTPRAEAEAGVRPLDTALLDAALAGLPSHELSFQHGVANVVGAVDRAGAQAGVLLRPVTVRQIIDIAHGGERMPPKTTFFHPKPRTGMVFRHLD
jgi:uncharacterized protein (DUF1015 family)